VRTTGARRPGNATKHNAIAPKNRISRKDAERHARFTEANGLPRPVAKTFSGTKPQVSRRSSNLSADLSVLARWALAVRPELQGFSLPLDKNACRRSYYSHEIEDRQACLEVRSESDLRAFLFSFLGSAFFVCRVDGNLLRWRTISFTGKGLGCIRGPIRAIVTLLIPLQKD
jgi:hypothetical protein